MSFGYLPLVDNKELDNLKGFLDFDYNDLGQGTYQIENKPGYSYQYSLGSASDGYKRIVTKDVPLPKGNEIIEVVSRSLADIAKTFLKLCDSRQLMDDELVKYGNRILVLNAVSNQEVDRSKENFITRFFINLVNLFRSSVYEKVCDYVCIAHTLRHS